MNVMYITVMRVNSASRGRGINIFLHRPDVFEQSDPWKVVDDPGPRVKKVDQNEVPRGGNRVEAYLDLFFDERDYSSELLDWALNEVESAIEKGTRNPANVECVREGRVVVRVVFSVNLGLEDLMSKRRVFNDLRGALKRWERQHEAEIKASASGDLQAAG
ncbi:hypothetical protein WMF11_12515 [Sorangium sp. So ce295]|jgi:hypothetical protein|uniref:hypothetical protein n=1 Tax=Sorangium sp. So ce295 TaxID=3133295 RepID=UPI003F621429